MHSHKSLIFSYNNPFSYRIVSPYQVYEERNRDVVKVVPYTVKLYLSRTAFILANSLLANTLTPPRRNSPLAGILGNYKETRNLHGRLLLG